MLRKLTISLCAAVAVLTASCAHGTTHHPGSLAAKARVHGSLKAHNSVCVAKPCKVSEIRQPRMELGNTLGYGHVFANHYRHGRLIEARDMGYGVITNVGVLSMSNDAFWAGPSGAPINTLALEKFCASGTGATAAAATDMALQTWDSISPVTGTITLNSAANSQGEKVTCTIAYTGTEAVTEWGLFNNGTLSATTGTPWTAGSATTGTATGTPYTASSTTVQGEQEFVFEDTTKSPNIYCLVISNTSSAVTCPAWYNVTNGNAAGTFPANTDALKIVPVMLDHMVFSAINVINGDSIQFVFSLSLPSGSFIFFFMGIGSMRRARRFVR